MKILYFVRGLEKGGAERIVIDIANEIHTNHKQHTIKILGFIDKNNYSEITKSINFEVLDLNTKKIFGCKNLENQINDIINQFEPEIIHSHLYQSEIISRIKIYPKIKYFTHLHSNYKEYRFWANSLKRTATNFKERRTLFKNYVKVNNKFFGISKFTINYAKKYLPKNLRKNIIYFPNAIKYDSFYNHKRPKHHKIKLISVGRLDKNKNQILIIDILKCLIEKNLNAELILIGNGTEKDHLINYTEKCHLSKFVDFKGEVNNVSKYLSESNFYVHSAISEAFGLTILEAMASGTPVLTLDGKGNVDFIKNGINGYIFDAQTPLLFANKIIELYKNPKLYKEISLNGQKTAKNYDIKNYVEKLLEIYQKK